MSNTALVAIVLAGGTSSRFGSDKLSAELEGRPLLHHALDAVASVAALIVVVVAPEAPEPRLPAGLEDRVRVARDLEAHGGPLAGLAAGLAMLATEEASVRDEAPRIALVVGGDMPGLMPAVLRLLAARLATATHLDVMTLAASPAAPLPMAVRPAAVSDAVATCLAADRRSLRALLDFVPSALVSESSWRALDPGARTLADVDRPEDLARG